MAEKAKKGKLRTKAKKAVTTGKPLTAKDKEVQLLNDNVETLYEDVTGIPKPPIGEKRDPKDTRKFIDGVYKEAYQIGQTTPKRFQEVMASDDVLADNDPITRAIGNIKARKRLGSLGSRGAWNY
jgi:hypothetical protein